MISSPYPLPLLLPRVDLRGKSSCLGYTVTNAKIFDTFMQAAGIRRFTSALFSGGRFGADKNGDVYYERDSSFTFQCSTAGILGPAMGSVVSSIQQGSVHRVYFTSPSWSTQLSSPTSYSFTLNGTSYSVSITSLDSLFTYSQNYVMAGSSASLSQIANLQYYPWNVDWESTPMTTATATPTAADMQTYGLRYYGTTAKNNYRPIGFAPKRPLQSTPKQIAEERVDQLVSLSGRSYRASYARRRIYEVTLLLDGPLDRLEYDAEVLWRRFLACADAGVSLFVDREWPSQFWRPRTAVVCPSMPNMISGALLDASSLKLVTRHGIPDAYEVTIQIADESDIEGVNFGGVTI